jgi:4-amino-4-deoxy-L-arabinose transferase-like glycosyltransferase
MLHVSIFVEGLRSRPRLMVWLATLAQTAIWWLVPAIFYAAPPGELPLVLAVGHEFQLGTDLGPPLAFWLAEIVHFLFGIAGVYLLAQACVAVTYWAVFCLGRAIVGEQQAAMAVLLMLGILVMTVPSPDFGPATLGMAFSALTILHFWRAIGESRRQYWFVLALDLGLLLLTTYAGLILFACVMLFLWATERGRAALQTVEPWFAAIVVAVLLFPHLIWLDIAGDTTFGPLWERLHSREAADTNLLAWLRLIAIIVAVHAGLLILVGLAAGWWRTPREPLPTFVRPPLDQFARRFVLFLAMAPLVVATLIAAIAGAPGPVGGIAPYVTLSGLAAVVAAGDTIVIHRQRILGLAWTLMLLLPPAITVAAILAVPWTAAIELKSAQPADLMGAFFADTFQRRTGKPLEIVSGDPRLASLVALAAPARPSYYDDVAPARTPWVTADDIRKKGLIVVWPARDTAGAGLPPADVKARFPDLVPEVPRAFAHAIQGRLPLARVGWGMLRPVAEGAAPR